MVFFIKKSWKKLNFKKNWWKIAKKSKKKFKVFTNFKKVTSNKLNFKSLRWFSKRHTKLERIWSYYIKIKNIKYKNQYKFDKVLLYMQRQTTKHVLYFDFICGKKLDVLIASLFGGTIAKARDIIYKNQVLVNGKIVSEENYFINIGDFVQIEPPSYFDLLKYKHFLINWKKNQYRGYILNINLLGILFNKLINISVLVNFKIWQRWIRRQDSWQTQFTKFQKKIIDIKNIYILFSRK